MFHLHFHFEESYAAWIQAAASIVGIYYIIQAFRQGNKNIKIANKNTKIANENFKLQLNALRNSIKPQFEIVSAESAAELTTHRGAGHIFIIQCQNHDATNVTITVSNTKYLEFYDQQSKEARQLWVFFRYPKNKRIGIYFITKSLTFVEEQALKASEPLEFNIIIKLEYSDEQGYSYRQYLQTSVDHPSQATFGKVEYL